MPKPKSKAQQKWMHSKAGQRAMGGSMKPTNKGAVPGRAMPARARKNCK